MARAILNDFVKRVPLALPVRKRRPTFQCQEKLPAAFTTEVNPLSKALTRFTRAQVLSCAAAQVPRTCPCRTGNHLPLAAGLDDEAELNLRPRSCGVVEISAAAAAVEN